MKKLFLIFFLSFLISQEANPTYLKIELEKSIADINARQFANAISRIDNIDFSDSEYLNHALILKLKALHGLNNIDQSLFIAKQVNDDELGPNLKTIYHMELGDIFSELSLFDKSFEHYLNANKSNIDTRAKKRINQRLNKLLRMGLSQNSLSSIGHLEENANNLNIIKLAQSFTLASNKSENWKAIFSSVDYSMLSREFRSSYNYLKKNLSTENYSIKKVGVVLSLTGDNSDYAKAYEDMLFTFCNRNQITCTEVIRGAINLTYNNGQEKCFPHVDHAEYHKQLIIYLNDPKDKEAHTVIMSKDTPHGVYGSDGIKFPPDKYELKRIVPEKYKGVCFENLPHYQHYPRFGDRIVAVFTFK